MSCGRHWFSKYGWVGRRQPFCVRYGCNAPNPNWHKEREEQIEMLGQEEIERLERDDR